MQNILYYLDHMQNILYYLDHMQNILYYLDHMQNILYYLHIAFTAIAVGKSIMFLSHLKEFSVRCRVGNRVSYILKRVR